MARGGAGHSRDGVAGLDVVDAKLAPPRRRDHTITRPAALARIDTAPRHVVVRAPAGYGKTTLVREWIDTVDRPSAWLTLDAGDDDPVVFFRHLVAAFATVVEVPAAWTVAQRPAAWNRTAALAALAADLAEAPPSVLVLDDLHEVISAAVLDFGDGMLDALPATVRVVIVTRGEPGPRRHRRLLDGSLAEVDVDDLRLDRDASLLLLRATVPDLDPEVAEVAVDRCDGWAAGLALVGLALAGAPDARAVASGLSLADRPVAEYLRDEVLRGLDPDARAFMVGTSVLTRLTAPLCDATLGRTDSHEILESLTRGGNLFVVGLDDGGTSYRYHHLWRELLLAELRGSDPKGEAGLRRRAAAWLETQGRVDDAVPQWLEAGATTEATRLIARHNDRYLITGRVATLQRWLGAFTPPQVRAEPTLSMVAAWIAAFTGSAEEVDHWLDRLAKLPADTVLIGGGSLRTDYAAAEMVSGSGGTKVSIRAADVVVEAGPDDNAWWATARVMGTVARCQAGLIDDPDGALADAEAAVSGAGPLEALARAHRSWFRFRAGHGRDAQFLAASAMDDIVAAGLEEYTAYVVITAIHAAVHARGGGPAAVQEPIERGSRLLAESPAFSARARTFCHLLLADALLTLDEPAAAAGHLAVASVLGDTEPDTVVLHDYADELAARLDAATGAGLLEPLSAAELRVLRELPTHRSLREIAASLYVSRNTVKTQTIAIYRKLGVSGRSAAVDRARELGLLAP